jgi:hypothetical protein
MLSLPDIVADLGFVLVIDDCDRGCGHCPAYGDRTPVQRAPLTELARASLRHGAGWVSPLIGGWCTAGGSATHWTT